MPSTISRRTLDLAGLDVPLVEVTGSDDGPLLTVISGVHGCEYASMAGVRRWTAGLAGRDLRGRVRAVPVLNLPAFWGRTPFVVPDDRKNLNRCFPGDPAGTLAERLAYATYTQLITGSDALVDAHCGDLVEALEPFALYVAGPAEDRARDMAVAYGLGYVIRQEAITDPRQGGMSSQVAAQLGIPAITAESGECGLVQEDRVQAHVRGLNRLLVQLGMTDADADHDTAPAPTHLRQFIWMRSVSEGWWEPAVRTGEKVTEGQVLGTISTLDGGEVLETITAPTAGVPIFITSSPAVAADGLLLGLGAS
jgi:uncharacterized protein